MGRKEIRGDSSENPEDFGRCAGEEEAPSVRACARASGGGRSAWTRGLWILRFIFFFFLSSFSSANSQPYPMNYGVYFARCTPYYIPGSLKSAKNGSKKSSLWFMAQILALQFWRMATVSYPSTTSILSNFGNSKNFS